jgi:hypothetical protein
MMGPTSLSTIRAEVRKAFKKSDSELLAWFNHQLDDLRRRPKRNKSEIETLCLLRDALVNEAQSARPRRRRPAGRSRA